MVEYHPHWNKDKLQKNEQLLQELNTISRWEVTEQEVPVLNKKVGCVGWGRNYCADNRTSVMITVPSGTYLASKMTSIDLVEVAL